MKTLYSIIIYIIVIFFALTLKLPYLFYLFLISFGITFLFRKKSLRVITNPKFVLFSFLFICVVPLILGTGDSEFQGVRYSYFYFELSTTLILRGALMIISISFLTNYLDLNIFIKNLAGRKGILPLVTGHALQVMTFVTQDVTKTYNNFEKKYGKRGVYIHPIKFLGILFINLEILASNISIEKNKPEIIEKQVDKNNL